MESASFSILKTGALRVKITEDVAKGFTPEAKYSGKTSHIAHVLI